MKKEAEGGTSLNTMPKAQMRYIIKTMRQAHADRDFLSVFELDFTMDFVVRLRKFGHKMHMSKKQLQIVEEIRENLQLGD